MMKVNPETRGVQPFDLVQLDFSKHFPDAHFFRPFSDFFKVAGGFQNGKDSIFKILCFGEFISFKCAEIPVQEFPVFTVPERCRGIDSSRDGKVLIVVIK